VILKFWRDRKLTKNLFSSFMLVTLAWISAACDNAFKSSTTSDASSAHTLEVSPSNGIVLLNGTLQVASTAGTGPYTYTIDGSSGSIGYGSGTISSTGLYQAPNTAGTVVVKVTDASGRVGRSVITVNNFLSLAPATRFAGTLTAGTIVPSYLYIPTVNGGIPPYTFSLPSGPGSVSSSTGVYTPPNDDGTVPRIAVLRVTDTAGFSRDIQIYVQPVLSSTPSAPMTDQGGAIRIEGHGGVCPYNFSIASGAGALAQVAYTMTNFSQGAVVCNAALFVAPASAGATVIRIVDAVNNVKDVTVTTSAVPGPVQMPTLTITPTTRLVAAGSTTYPNPAPPLYSFVATGGVLPYSYSLTSGPGAVGALTGVYLPPNDSSILARTALVRATDGVGAYREATIFIQPSLDITVTAVPPVALHAPTAFAIPPSYALPSTTRNRTVSTNSLIRLDGIGGLCNFTFSLVSGAGRLMNYVMSGFNNYSQTSATCSYALFQAPVAAGSTVVRVTDAQGNWTDSIITVSDTSLGAEDSSFDSDGSMTISFGGGDDVAMAQAIDAAGNIVVAGHSYNTSSGNFDFALSRITSAGVLDTTFNAGGAFGNLATAGKLRLDINTNSNDYVTSIAIQSTGEIVVSGHCENGAGSLDFCLIRILADGSGYDTTFDTDGIGIYGFPAGGNDYLNAIKIDSGSGKIIAAGNCYSGSTVNVLDPCALRLSSTGALDVTFDTDGLAVQTFAGNDYINGMILLANGSVVLGGSCSLDFCLVKLTSAGALDTDFPAGAGTGRLTFTTGTNMNLTETNANLITQSDGKILMAASVYTAANTSNTGYLLARITSDGLLDESFGIDGRILIETSPFTNGATTSGNTEYLHSLARQADGKIVAVGKYFSAELNYDSSAMRLTSDGSLDLAFGSGGRWNRSVNTGSAFARAVNVQSNGRIVISGAANNGTDFDFQIVRIYP
jgi:uncharacterized delta-60 repeat protein